MHQSLSRTTDNRTREEPRAPSISIGSSDGGVLELQRLAGNRAVAALVAQRDAEGVGAVGPGMRLNVDNSAWRAPGQAGYSQLLIGASGQLARDMMQSGDLGNALLRRAQPEFGEIPREQARYTAMKANAGRRRSGLNPPSIEAMLEQQQANAQGQLDAIALTREEQLVFAAKWNAIVPQGNAFVLSAARSSSMQMLVGATDNASLIRALVSGLDEASTTAQDYIAAYRRNSPAAGQALAAPSVDDTVREAAQNVSDAARTLGLRYRDFRISEMENLIQELDASGRGDRTRLATINRYKSQIRNLGKAIDTAMSIVSPGGAVNLLSPGTDIPDATKKAVEDVIPSLGGTTSFIGDIVFMREVQQIEERLAAIDNLVSAERGAINEQRYQRQREGFSAALRTYRERMEQLQNRITARRTSYRTMGEQLDRFARSGRARTTVAQGRERFSTILTITAQIREALALARWSAAAVREAGLRPADIRRWYAQVTASRRPEGAAARRWRAIGLTDGERIWLQGLLQQVEQFSMLTREAQRMFNPVDEAASRVMGSAAISDEPGEGAY